MIPLNISLASAQLHQPVMEPKQGEAIRKLFDWKDSDHLILRIDWSSLSDQLSCNRLAEFKLVHSKSRATTPALVFGAAMHSALELYYKRGRLCDKSQLYTDAKLIIDKEFAESGLLASKDYRTPEYCLESFVRYVNFYKDEPFFATQYEDKPMVEFGFHFPLGETLFNPRTFDLYTPGQLTTNADLEQAAPRDKMIRLSIEWSGLVDGIFSDGDTNYVVDHKTTSMISGDFFDTFEIATQPIGYVLACKRNLPEIPISGFMVNVIACRKPTKSGVSFEPMRRIYHYQEHHFQDWILDTLAIINELLFNLSENYFPRKTSWCAGKYGKCAFFDVCNLPPAMRMAQLETYQHNTWKPV